MPVAQRVKWKIAVTAVAAVAAGLGIFLAGFPRQFWHVPKRNVVLIVADAFRGDRIGYQRAQGGLRKSITPNLDRLASQGCLYERAMAPSSWTTISIASILYNAPPTKVGYGAKGFFVDSTNESITELLKKKGYYNAVISGNCVLDVPAVTKGFDYTFFSPGRARKGVNARLYYRSSSELNKKAGLLRKQLRASKSFFLYVHYVDTHEPYFALTEVMQTLGGMFDSEIFTTRINKAVQEGRQFLPHDLPPSQEKTEDAEAGAAEPARLGYTLEEALTRLKDHYDASVYETDRSVAALLAMLDDSGLLDDTLVIFTSDHGEEFLDNAEDQRRWVGHNGNLSQPQIHSPLIVWQKKGGAFTGAGSVTPPVSSAAVINGLIRGFSDGGNPADVVAETGRRWAPIVSALNFEGFNGFSYINGNVKIEGRFTDTGEFADVKAFNLAGAGGAVVTAAAAQLPAKLLLDVHAALRGQNAPAFDQQNLTAGDQEKLRALGYLN